MSRKLYRSEDNKVVGGVCGGVGDYLDIDPTLIRIVTVILFFATGIGPVLLAYIVGLIIMPKRPLEAEPIPVDREYSSWHKYLPGMILIAIGTLFLMHEVWWWFNFDAWWPLVLIIGGLYLIFRKRKDYHFEEGMSAAEQQTQNGESV